MRKVPYFHPESGTYTNRRRWVGLSFFIFLIGVPFIVIDGASLFLLDIVNMEFHLFFRVFPFTQFYVLFGLTIAGVAGLIYVTLIWGRVWCGWMCPQTIITDFLRVFEKFWLPRKNIKGVNKYLRLIGSYATMTGFVFLVALDVVWYFINPYDFLNRLTTGTLSAFAIGSLAVSFIITWLDMVIVRQSFCEYLCPYAKMQGALFSESTTVVAYDEKRGETDCTKCLMCVRVCPAGIDIRDGLQMSCIACAACVDACEPIMAKKGKANLVRYWSAEKTPSLLRDKSFMVALVAIIASLFVIWQVFFKIDLQVNLSRNSNFTGKIISGQIVNGYTLVLDNLGSDEKRISVSITPAEFKLLPPITYYLVKGNETVRLPLMVELPVGKEESEFILVVEDNKGDRKEINQGFFRVK
ncbi:MAG: 4Fe-4S binding protein [Bacteroidetes bacterium]|nr:4Fe-4S binding protein [Bacteroidota bacterium]